MCTAAELHRLDCVRDCERPHRHCAASHSVSRSVCWCRLIAPWTPAECGLRRAYIHCSTQGATTSWFLCPAGFCVQLLFAPAAQCCRTELLASLSRLPPAVSCLEHVDPHQQAAHAWTKSAVLFWIRKNWQWHCHFLWPLQLLASGCCMQAVGRYLVGALVAFAAAGLGTHSVTCHRPRCWHNRAVCR